jgi:hypothetical protein
MALIAIFQLHRVSRIYSFNALRSGIWGGGCVLFFLFLFIQINFAAISHNFGMKFIAFFSSQLGLIVGEIFCIGLIWYTAFLGYNRRMRQGVNSVHSHLYYGG